MSTASLDEFAGHLYEAYGVRLDYAGDDGWIVMLGHQSNRRAIAAANRLARERCGLVNVADNSRVLYADAVNHLDHTYAELITQCEGANSSEHEDSCPTCAEIRDATWFVRWGKTIDGPNSFPVTVWS